MAIFENRARAAARPAAYEAQHGENGPSESRGRSKQSGFTMVELAIVITMAGIAFFAIANTYTSLDTKIRRDRTFVNFAAIEDALAAYAARNYRLPCPMAPDFGAVVEPYGAEMGSTATGAVTPADCPILEGIVPFATLSLDEETARDGYGHFITYRVARPFARDPEDGANVHENCRSRAWMHTAMNGGGSVNINPRLARFCCRAPEGLPNELDVDFRRDFGAGVQNMWRLGTDGTAARYAAVNTAGPVLAATTYATNVTRPAYVLLSHGRLGVGAFSRDGTGLRQPGRRGTEETINGTETESRFILAPNTDIANNRMYDDLMVWGTQDTILARSSGRFSCHAPARE